MQDHLRAIPNIDLCLNALFEADSSLRKDPRTLMRDLVTAYWNQQRAAIRAGYRPGPTAMRIDAQLPSLLRFVRNGLKPRLRRVINATGVVIHTNLGRSVLAREAANAAYGAACNYTNLEMDLASGERGSRHDLAEDLIRRLTGAEAALVVNNNAAAVFLILDTLCKNGEVVVSRGELVEIGGSFRIPDIMAKSGATLREVGTTNRTHLKDYREAINASTKALMGVHTSNFRVIGFHAAVELSDLKKLAEENNLPLIFDLGSGNLLDFSEQGLPREPTVRDVISAGADCVCFSGDKALGGPQAGIIAGKKEFIDRFKKNPLARALRCDKLCLAALEATLRLYLDPDLARSAVPTPRMISRTAKELSHAAHNLGAKIKKACAVAAVNCDLSYQKDVSRVGGGTFPECNLETTLICLQPKNMSSTTLRTKLLHSDPPLIGRLDHHSFCLDPRTIAKSDYPEIISLVVAALKD